MDAARFYARSPDRLCPDFRAFLDDSSARGGDRPAILWRPEGEDVDRVMSYAELKRAADALGSRLLAPASAGGVGLAPGDHVALLGENRPEWCAAYLGIAAAGLVVVPLDAGLDERGFLNNLGAARCRVLVVTERFLKRHPGLGTAPGLEVLVVIEEAGVAAHPGTGESPRGAAVAGRSLIPWGDLVGSGPNPAGMALLPAPGGIGSSTRAVVFFTSGTTGIAKGIVLSHGAVLANVDAALAALPVDEGDVLVALLPLHHTYASTCTFLSPIAVGARIVAVDRVAPSAALRAIRDGRVSMLIGVPLLFDKVRAGIEAEIGRLPPVPRAAIRALIAVSRFVTLRLRLPLGRVLLGALRRKAGLASVGIAVSGGGPLAPATADFYDAIGIELVQGYGMSENGPLISVNLPGMKDNRGVGFPVRRTEVRIDSPGPDGIGEIEVRSPSLMECYLDAPAATAEVITADGWLRTGDLGLLDGRGRIRITGRRKNLIVTEGGKNVYPEEVEARFEGSAVVREVLVLGRRPRTGGPGEEIVAVCVPDFERIALDSPGRGKDPAFVASIVRGEVQRINRGLAPYMKICDHVVRETEFEKTSSRKIRRFLHAAEYARPRA